MYPGLIELSLVSTVIYCPSFVAPPGAVMSPSWGADGVLGAEHRRVDARVTARCPAGVASIVERFENGDTQNTITCLETGSWDMQLAPCARKLHLTLRHPPWEPCRCNFHLCSD